jgi:cytochrome P450
MQQMISYQFFGGPHACIGKQLALTEVKVAVIKFLRRYQTLIEPGLKNRGFVF